MTNHTIEIADITIEKVIDITCSVDAKRSKRLDMVVNIENENVTTYFKLTKNKKIMTFDNLSDATSWYNSL